MKYLAILFSLLFIYFSAYSQNKIRAWASEDSSQISFNNVMVIGLFENYSMRLDFEESVVFQAQKNRLKAQEGMNMFPPELGNPFQDMPRVRERLVEKGYDGLISIALFSINSKRYIPPTTVYQPISYYDRFGSYYSRSYAVFSIPGYVKPEEKYFIECNIYELKGGLLKWTARSFSFFTENLEENLKNFNKQMFKDLKNRGLIK